MAITYNHIRCAEDRGVKQPSDTLFSHPLPTFALFLVDSSNEGTSPGLWVLPDNYHQRLI